MQKVTFAYLHRRYTFTYAAGWNHLDVWGHSFRAKIRTSGVKWENSNEAGLEYLLVKTPKPMSLTQFKRYLDSFQSGCQCEYDCCGHVSTYALSHRAKRLGKREFSLTVQHVRNV